MKPYADGRREETEVSLPLTQWRAADDAYRFECRWERASGSSGHEARKVRDAREVSPDPGASTIRAETEAG
jgi:hypothetical protein